MPTQRIFRLLLVVVLAFLVAACGDDEPTATATPEAAAAVATDTPAPPTNTPVPPTNTPAAAPAADTPTPAAPAESSFESPNSVLKSYRTQGGFVIKSTFPDGSVTEQEMTLAGAFVRTDNAYGSDESFEMTIRDGDEVDGVALYKIGEWVSVKSHDEWITVGRDNAGLFTAMADLFTGFVDQFVAEREDAQNLGDEDVNGRPATHYRIDDVSIFERMAQMAPDSEEVIESVSMDVWVAKEGNFLLKYVVLAEVSNVPETGADGAEVLVAQSVNWTYEILDANADIVISLPADAPEPGQVAIPGFAEGEFPVPDGSTLSAGMLGMPEVTSDLSQEELVKFYTEAFAALGWTFAGDFGFYEVTKGEINFAMYFDVTDDGKSRAQVFAEQ